MSPICPWCGNKTLVETHTKGRYECTYCGLMCLLGFKGVPAPSPWPHTEPIQGGPHGPTPDGK